MPYLLSQGQDRPPASADDQEVSVWRSQRRQGAQRQEQKQLDLPARNPQGTHGPGCHACDRLLAPSAYFSHDLECSRCHLKREQDKRVEKSGINRTLFHAGAVLVASSCKHCHRLLPAELFYDSRPGACKTCAQSKSAEENWKSQATAHHKGQQWTSAEMEVVARKDLTALQVAVLLGRTKAAVQTRRNMIKTDPRAETLVGQVYEVANRRAEHVAELVMLRSKEKP
jgi:hypothetical protein